MISFASDAGGKARLPLISVCAWCWPLQEDYFRAHPEHKGRALSHTICPKHASQVFAKAKIGKVVGQ